MKIQDHFLTKETFELKETAIPGILKTTPLPSNLSRYYESDQYISHHQDQQSLKEKLYKFLQKFNLNFKRNTIASEAGINISLLDYGCGAGSFLEFMEPEYTTFGFELDQDALQIAKSKAKKTTFINSIDAIEDGSLDLITLWHVLEHIENRDEIISKFHAKLKQHGLLIIAVPNHTSYDAQKYKNYWAAYDVPRHIWHFSKKGMQTYFSTPNWNLRKIKPLLLDSFYIGMLSEKYKKSPLFWLKGFIYGGISNFKALKTGEFSSLVYIVEKK